MTIWSTALDTSWPAGLLSKRKLSHFSTKQKRKTDFCCDEIFHTFFLLKRYEMIYMCALYRYRRQCQLINQWRRRRQQQCWWRFSKLEKLTGKIPTNFVVKFYLDYILNKRPFDSMFNGLIYDDIVISAIIISYNKLISTCIRHQMTLNGS